MRWSIRRSISLGRSLVTAQRRLHLVQPVRNIQEGSFLLLAFTDEKSLTVVSRLDDVIAGRIQRIVPDEELRRTGLEVAAAGT